MYKLVDPLGWDWGVSPAALVKVATYGLRGTDRSTFLKRASHLFLDCLERLRPGESVLHAIALGATEQWGPNKNADGFKEATCKARLHTFEKHAHLYRDHINKDPAKSYGRIIKAAYHPEMSRVELLIGLNGTKEAAERNTGLVADKELDALEKDGDLRGSMACRVARDLCSCCGNSAKNRSEYCGPEKCAAGGCRDHLGQTVKVGGRLHHLHVDNPAEGLTWFDYSHITNRKQADRTAMGVIADWAQKAASAGGPAATGGAALAEAAGIDGPWSDTAAALCKLATAMAAVGALEPWGDEDLRRGCDPAFRPATRLDRRDPRLAEKLAALADVGVFLSPSEYAGLVDGGHGPGYAGLAGRLYDFEPHWAFADCEPGPAEREFARGKQASALTPAACAARATRSVLAARPAPAVALDDASGGYAAYKLAALWRFANADGGKFGLTVRAARVQDRLSA